MGVHEAEEAEDGAAEGADEDVGETGAAETRGEGHWWIMVVGEKESVNSGKRGWGGDISIVLITFRPT